MTRSEPAAYAGEAATTVTIADTDIADRLIRCPKAQHHPGAVGFSAARDLK